MAVATLRVTGLRETRAALRALSDRLPRELTTIGKTAAAGVAEEARRRAPHRSGALAGTIRTGATQTRAVVRAGNASVPYAGPIHFGWPARHIAPNPFLYDAADRRGADVALAYARGLQRLIDSVGLGAR